ncbi:ATP synthase subunit e, mitochondrial [Culicoides brevitarsis]|uniref:ATP synthase subunit e, mitochondrial n=1 Tax=Culicoides brevitarsis TaxID=469753 RepID=UPI00307C7F22
MADLGAPVRVSPLIKFGRWSFLAVGVAYGAYHQNRLSKKAAKEREIEAQKKVVRDAQMAAEKKKAQEREAAEWERMSAPAPKK